MKTIHISYSTRGSIFGLDVSEGIELGDIVELNCNGKTFLAHIVLWSYMGSHCDTCVLKNVRCLEGDIGICNRIVPGKRVCFQALDNLMEDI